METLENSLIFLAGLIFLIVSSDWLIHGCIKLSYIFRLTPLFIGLILVAFGTSAPEAGVGIMAAVKNQKDIALGNIIGSNIFNIGLILGLCAIFVPLRVGKSIVRRELPIMIFSVVLLYILSLDFLIDRREATLFLIFFVIFCFISYRGTKNSQQYTEIQNFRLKKILAGVNSSFIIIGVTLISLLGIIWGADLMIRGGVNVAYLMGVNPWIIGIIVFAVGTSLPELATSLSASFKKIPSISVGNIVGSNIFNILFVLGVVALIRPIQLQPSILVFELPVLLFFSLVLFLFIRKEYKITRWKGGVLLIGYLVFVTFLMIK